MLTDGTEVSVPACARAGCCTVGAKMCTGVFSHSKYDTNLFNVRETPSTTWLYAPVKMAIRLSRPTGILSMGAKIDQCLPVVPVSGINYTGADNLIAASIEQKVS